MDFIKNLNFADKQKLAVKFILLFGLVSAFGDITYEGATSVYGPYLNFFGAGALTVGMISGLGGFIGYALRLISGYFIDKTRKYWLVTIIGYALLISVPLLALANKWQIAAVLIILERTGKAIRTPGKDTMLSHAAKQLGTGFGFGIHETLDQIGGIIGPLIFTAVLAFKDGYKTGFNIMWIPAILTVFLVLLTRSKVPNPELLEISKKTDAEKLKSNKMLSKVFFLYSTFTFICVLGLANFPIISYHFDVQNIIPKAQIPSLYAAAMAADALIAPLVGKAYDKIGFMLLAFIPILTIPIGIFGFSKSYIFAIISIVLFGFVIGMQDTIMRAATADFIPVKNRGSAYGIFNTLYGLALLIGNSLIGFLYEYSIIYIIAYIVIVEIIAIIVFIIFKKNMKAFHDDYVI